MDIAQRTPSPSDIHLRIVTGVLKQLIPVTFSGTACLGGCQPYWSYSPQSCAPQPVCSNGNVSSISTRSFSLRFVTSLRCTQFTFSNTSTVLLPYDTYNNDATAGNWTLDSGMAFVNEDDELVLTLSKTNGGTRLSSTRAFLYGNVSARLQTGRWEGVIAAWITMSGVRDEIDWEVRLLQSDVRDANVSFVNPEHNLQFVGNDTTVGQSSYYWQGNTAGMLTVRFTACPDLFRTFTDFKHSSNISITDSYSSWNDYGLSWLPDSLSWTVNDVVVRILYKNHTFNNVTNVYEYPQTPSRLQLGLWASGLKSEAESTIQWGGGLVDWYDPLHFNMFTRVST